MTENSPDLKVKAERVARKNELISVLLHQKSSNMSDAELLELLFSVIAPKHDAKKLSRVLLQKFGGIGEIINSDLDKFTQIPDISENMAVALKVISACSKRTAKMTLTSEKKPVFLIWDDFVAYCRQTMAYEEVENLRLFLLDDDMCWFKEENLSKGTVNKTVAHPREIVHEALKHSAGGIILAHNHPSEDCLPSEADILMTNEIIEAVESLGIKFIDHLIVTKGEIFSFRTNNLLKKDYFPNRKK